MKAPSKVTYEELSVEKLLDEEGHSTQGQLSIVAEVAGGSEKMELVQKKFLFYINQPSSSVDETSSTLSNNGKQVKIEEAVDSVSTTTEQESTTTKPSKKRKRKVKEEKSSPAAPLKEEKKEPEELKQPKKEKKTKKKKKAKTQKPESA